MNNRKSNVIPVHVKNKPRSSPRPCVIGSPRSAVYHAVPNTPNRTSGVNACDDLDSPSMVTAF